MSLMSGWTGKGDRYISFAHTTHCDDTKLVENEQKVPFKSSGVQYYQHVYCLSCHVICSTVVNGWVGHRTHALFLSHVEPKVKTLTYFVCTVHTVTQSFPKPKL